MLTPALARRPECRPYLPFAAAVLAVAGCQRTPPAMPPPPPPAVTVTRPVLYPVQTYYEYTGYLDAVEMVQVRARVKGVLQEVRFQEGAEVKAGDLLYTIDPREYEAAEAKAKADIKRAEADIANATAQVQLAAADLDRLRKLGASAAATETDKAVATLAANQAQRDVAVANREAGEAALRTARLDLEYTRIKAPIGGRINRTLVTPGNLVGQSEPTLLTTIVRMDELYVYYDAAERDLIEQQRALQASPHTAAGATLRVDVGVATEEGYPHPGAIDFRENRVDTGTGTVRVRGRLPNPFVPPGNVRLLYPGLFARVRVPAGPPRTLPVVPEDALMTGQEGRYVYVLGPENAVQRRLVSVVPQPVWKAPPPDGNPVPGWTLAAAPAPPGDGAETPTGPTPVPSVVAIEKGVTADDRLLVTGLTKSRPGAPVAPRERPLQPPATK